jgi:hypothetical protein
MRKRKKAMNNIKELTEKFLRWPVPHSVCADLCATKQQEGRTGTNFFSYSEAEAMIKYLISDNQNDLDNKSTEKS